MWFDTDWIKVPDNHLLATDSNIPPGYYYRPNPTEGLGY